MSSRPDIRQGWFQISELERGVWEIYEPFHAERVRSHLVIGEREAMLLDTGMGVGDIRAVVAELTDLPVRVVNSHAHWDHIGGNWRFERIAIHAAEADDLLEGVLNRIARSWFGPESLTAPLPADTTVATIEIRPSRATELLHGGETIDLGGFVLEVIHAPGHSPGGIVLFERTRKILFSTDVAYASTLYCTADHSELPVYVDTMERLARMSGDIRVCYPSHDDAVMDPALLGEMHTGLAAILAGRPADKDRGTFLVHRFDRFGVRVRPGAAV